MKQVFSLIITVVLLVVFSPDGASQPRKKKDFRGKGDEKVGLVKWSDFEEDKKHPVSVEPPSPREILQEPGVDNLSADYLLFRNVTKKDGWLVGIGDPISEEIAGHLPTYYKLSRKNKLGHWTLVQAYDSYGNLTTNHSMGAYLLNPNDDTDEGANEEMKDNLQRVCQWQMVANNDGTEVSREIAYDAYNDVLYSFYPVKERENVFLGHYTDARGLPVNLRQGTPTYVRIIRDANGFDSVIEMVDERGRVLQNSDKAYQSYREYDEKGHVVRTESRTRNGVPMKDMFGNCGWVTEFDPKTGWETRTYCIDEKGNKIYLPITSRSSDHICERRTEYDEWGRAVAMSYYGINSEPDTTSSGIHKLVLEFDEKGNRTCLKGYDLYGKLHSFNSYGIACNYSQFDNWGHVINDRCYDNQMMPATWGNYSSYECTYSDDGQLNLLEKRWVVVDGEEIESYRYKYSPDTRESVETYPLEGYYLLRRYDDRDRKVFHGYFELDGTPTAISGYHKRIRIFSDKNGSLYEDDSYYDVNGELVYNEDAEYCRMVTLEDSLKHAVYCYQYRSTKEGSTPYAYLNQYDEQFEKRIAQFSLTPLGTIGRTGQWHNIFIKVEFSKNIDGELETMSFFNEFGEPAYLTDSEWERAYHSVFIKDTGREYLDLDGTVITDMESFMKQTPQAFCVEVVDTTKSRRFKDGDIIVGWGNWFVGEDMNANMPDFYSQVVLSNPDNKTVWLVRYDQNGQGKLVKESLGAGTPDHYGIYIHRIWYTPSEVARLKNTLTKNNFSYGEPVSAGKDVLLVIPVKNNPESGPYYKGYRNPGILFFSQYFDDDNPYVSQVTSVQLGDGMDVWTDNNMFGSDGATVLYYCYDLEREWNCRYAVWGKYKFNVLQVKIPEESFEQLYLIALKKRESDNLIQEQVNWNANGGSSSMSDVIKSIAASVTEEIVISRTKRGEYTVSTDEETNTISDEELQVQTEGLIKLSKGEGLDELLVVSTTLVGESNVVERELNKLNKKGYQDLSDILEQDPESKAKIVGRVVNKNRKVFIQEMVIVDGMEIILFKGNISTDSFQSLISLVLND